MQCRATLRATFCKFHLSGNERKYDAREIITAGGLAISSAPAKWLSCLSSSSSCNSQPQSIILLRVQAGSMKSSMTDTAPSSLSSAAKHAPTPATVSIGPNDMPL
jgi:hypothetical protein